MGAGQSSNAGPDSSASKAGDVKTSYYELLGIERSATDDEIKRAYRRKALELHPDRNYDNVERATRLFAEVQSAHEVLSDPQERAWYDAHESAILRGDDDATAQEQHFENNVKVTSADDIARMMRKFNSAVDFTDAPSGFFGFLRETFAQLAKEEEVAGHYEGVAVPDYPSFGHGKDEYEDVVRPFYAVWIGFATRKTFAWKDQYRLSEAPDRRYRRLMEKENKRLREEGIREFNDAVRSLIAFVRKRDPRYTPNTQSEEERQKILRDAAAAQAARARATNGAKLEQHVPQWAQVVEKDELDGEIEEEESEEEHYECVACRKTFKSEKQWDAHEKSKKHQKALHALQKKMRKENKHLDLDDEQSSSGVMTPASEDDAEPGEDGIATANDAHRESANEDIAEVQLDDLTIGDDKKFGTLSGEDDDEADTAPPAPRAEDDTESGSEDSDYASPETVQNRLQSALDPSAASKNGESMKSDDDDEEGPATTQPKLGKAAQKRAKKAAAAASATSAAEQTDNKLRCASCSAAFPSKTRLHQHIKDFGHAAPKAVGGTAGGGGKGKKGKR